MQIAIADAKAQFSELIRRAEAGEAIELTRYGQPVARIVSAKTTQQHISLIGAMKGEFTLPEDNADEDIAELFPRSV